MLILADFHDFEFIIAAGIEQAALPHAGARRRPRFVRLPLAARRSSISEMWQRPSMPSASSTNAPNVVTRETFPRTRSPTLCFSNHDGPDVIHLLHAKRNAPRALVDLQHFRFDRVALLVNFRRVLDSPGPRNVADVNQAIEAFLDFQERAELRKVADSLRSPSCRRDIFPRATATDRTAPASCRAKCGARSNRLPAR